jgi:hypothetical protein
MQLPSVIFRPFLLLLYSYHFCCCLSAFLWYSVTFHIVIHLFIICYQMFVIFFFCDIPSTMSVIFSLWYSVHNFLCVIPSILSVIFRSLSLTFHLMSVIFYMINCLLSIVSDILSVNTCMTMFLVISLLIHQLNNPIHKNIKFNIDNQNQKSYMFQMWRATCYNNISNSPVNTASPAPTHTSQVKEFIMIKSLNALRWQCL